jgi:hypothetical protein
MRDIKPDGWSVVWRANEISIRPSDRALGRFSTIFSERHGFSVSFFCHEAGIWNKRRRFSDGSTIAAEIVRWMVRATDDPNREERDDHAA